MNFEVGALYSRRNDIHDVFDGQRQGGISTPANQPLVFIFLGEAGKVHGYHDFVDDEGVLHYYGEGQRGDMQMRAGNLAIDEHEARGKALLVFQALGKGKPYRFLGQYRRLSSYIDKDVLDTDGALRNAIVFRLAPIDLFASFLMPFNIAESDIGDSPEETDALRSVRVRTKQSLFRRRVILVEKGCRLTGLVDLRFLRASHIKPWSHCIDSVERLDGNNGLLLCPQADHLFDGGWITFDEKHRLVVSASLPSAVRPAFGLQLKSGLRCGTFNSTQQTYLAFHRENVFEQRVKSSPSLLSSAANGYSSA